MPRARKTNRQIWRNNGSVLEGASGWPHSPKTTSSAARRSGRHRTDGCDAWTDNPHGRRSDTEIVVTNTGRPRR